MKRRTKMFADKLIEDPTKDGAQAYIETHQQKDKKIARVNASQLLAKPEVMQYMQKHAESAEKTIIQVMKNSNNKEHKNSVQWQRLAHESANSILDRVHGKPLARTNSLNTNINLEIAFSELN